MESLFDQDYYDAYSLQKAMEGAGTRENTLTEILTSRSNQQIENIKILYKKCNFNRITLLSYFENNNFINVTFEIKMNSV